ncbi:hypothetical protein TURU_127896 [Turdus rufiventris]|nr:hypothetical protein TURU_127896 [Turdus rufiventris]
MALVAGQRRRGSAEPSQHSPSGGREVSSRACTAPSPASKPCDLAILLLTGNFVKVARGSSLRMKVRFIIRCGLYMDKE